jgi:AcrR family transcriptional regulator
VPTVQDLELRSRYHSPLRARQAAQTRRAVLAAAARLFCQRGWAGTTMAAVAAEAGTAVETVYAGSKSKSRLLTDAIDAALVGDDEPVALTERAEFARLGVGARQERMGRAAHLIALTHRRSVPLLRTLQEAAASDPGASTRWEKYEADRRTVISLGLRLVTGDEAPAAVVDAIWALASPEVYHKLVVERGWKESAYEQWLIEVATPAIADRADGASK